MKKAFLIFSTLLATALMADAARFTNEMRDNFFSPASRTIAVGDTVRWINRGFGFHNVVSASYPFDSGNTVGNGGIFEFTFTKTGTFTYICEPHAPGMAGTIIVQAAANNPPTVTITQPTNNQIFDAPANFTVQATANDTSPGTVTNVQFFVDTTSIGNDTSSPYSAQASNIAAGTHSIRAVASDNNGARATNTISITVNPPANVPPTVTINSPTNGQSYVAPANVNFNATVGDTDGSIALVEFLLNGNALGSTNQGGSVERQFNVPTPGAYSLIIIATDNGGAKSTNSVSITVNPPPVNSPPTIQIHSPTNGQSFVAPASSTVNSSVNDADGAITLVEFLTNGTVMGSTNSGGNFQTPFLFPNPGTFVLSIVATDDEGAKATNSVTITVTANPPPVITINSPTNGQHFVLPATATLDASVTDSGGTIVLVEFLLNGASIGGTNTGGQVRRDFPIPAPGTYTLTIIATDNQNLKTTNSVSITATTGTGGAAPKISNLQKTSDGKIRFLVDVSTNQNATVQGKGDLNGPFLTITNVKGGSVFEETILRSTNRFYRVGVTNAP